MSRWINFEEWLNNEDNLKKLSNPDLEYFAFKKNKEIIKGKLYTTGDIYKFRQWAREQGDVTHIIPIEFPAPPNDE
jgi:hypothetical protein